MTIDGFIATEDGDAAPGAQWDEEMQQSYLDAAELIDEYILYISPLALSGGGHLFRDVGGAIPVRSASTRPFTSA